MRDVYSLFASPVAAGQMQVWQLYKLIALL